MTTDGWRLRRAITALAHSKNGRRYAPSLRARVVAYARGRLTAGASSGAICAELGMGPPTLARFLAARTERARFAEVRIAAPRDLPSSLPGADPQARAPIVRGPLGVVVEGLSLEEVASLLRSLSCSA